MKTGSLRVVSSGTDRKVPKGTILTVIDRNDEVAWLARTELSVFRYDTFVTITVPNAILRSPGGGTRFGLSCPDIRRATAPDFGYKYVTKPDGKQEAIRYQKGYSATEQVMSAAISRIQKYFEVTIAKAIVVP